MCPIIGATRSITTSVPLQTPASRARSSGIDHEMNLSVARRALVRRQVDGEFPTMEALADSVGRGRSTVSRWFAGRPLHALRGRFGGLTAEFPAPCA